MCKNWLVIHILLMSYTKRHRSFQLFTAHSAETWMASSHTAWYTILYYTICCLEIKQYFVPLFLSVLPSAATRHTWNTLLARWKTESSTKRTVHKAYWTLRGFRSFHKCFLWVWGLETWREVDSILSMYHELMSTFSMFQLRNDESYPHYSTSSIVPSNQSGFPAHLAEKKSATYTMFPPSWLTVVMFILSSSEGFWPSAVFVFVGLASGD